MHPSTLAALVAGTLCSIAAAPAIRPATQAAGARPIRAMTFNIRYAAAPDGRDAWPLRRAMLADAIRAADPDVLAAQEVLAVQADFLREQFPGYHFVGVGREDGRTAGEFAPVLARADRFDLLASGTFWLSPTPEVPGSVGWDAALTRICSWARLRDRGDGAVLIAASCHFDHQGERARIESAKLLRERLARLADGVPVLLLGDFNASPGSPPYDALFGGADGFADAFRAVHPTPTDADGTFHAFTGRADPASRIDWIATRPAAAWHVESAEIDRFSRDGRYPSDHFPVTAVLRLRPAN